MQDLCGIRGADQGAASGLSTSLLDIIAKSFVLHPNQFEINEAWIAFRLNDVPIVTEQDGSFNCVALMDAASCYILRAELVPGAEAEPSQQQARHLLQAAWAEKRQFPRTLLVASDHCEGGIAREAEQLGIAVVSVPEDQLLVFIGEAREGYRQHMQSGARGDA